MCLATQPPPCSHERLTSSLFKLSPTRSASVTNVETTNHVVNGPVRHLRKCLIRNRPGQLGHKRGKTRPFAPFAQLFHRNARAATTTESASNIGSSNANGPDPDLCPVCRHLRLRRLPCEDAEWPLGRVFIGSGRFEEIQERANTCSFAG
jgi:hypothetical protein